MCHLFPVLYFIWCLLNHSEDEVMIPIQKEEKELLTGIAYKEGESVSLKGKGVIILES